MIKLLRILLLLVLPWIATSCYDCGPMGEPYVQISINGKSAYQKVSALGARSDSAFTIYTPQQYGFFERLPISLLQDSTTFLFYAENRVDTLTLYYQRIFDVSKGCGYYNDIKAPERGPYFRGSFSEASIEYRSYLGPTSMSNPGIRGIFINIRAEK